MIDAILLELINIIMDKEDLLISAHLMKNNLRRVCVERCLKIDMNQTSINQEEEKCLGECSSKMSYFLKQVQLNYETLSDLN